MKNVYYISFGLLLLFFSLSTHATCGGDGTGGEGGGGDYIDYDAHRLRLINQSGSIEVSKGEDHSFGLTLEHNYPITVSWFKDGELLPDSGGIRYLLNDINPEDAGIYSCTITDGELTAYCAEFTLTVRPNFTLRKQGLNQAVQAIALTPGGTGEIYVGGMFSSYNGNHSGHIARFNSDGSIDTTFMVGEGFNDGFGTYINTIVPAGDASGDIYVGGQFIEYNGSSSHNIIRLNNDASIDEAFAVGSGFLGWVETIASADDGSGDIYVGGGFSSYRNKARNRIIRLNEDGSVDDGFSVGEGFDRTVSEIALARDGSGDIYVSGSFSSYNGTPVGYLVRLNSDGSLDEGFTLDTGIASYISDFTLAADGTGDIYVGSTYSPPLRLNSDGSVDENFVSDLKNSETLEIASDGSGDIFVVNRRSIVRLSGNGAKISTFSGGRGFDGALRVLIPDDNGDIYVGGYYHSYNGTNSSGVIRLAGDGTVSQAYSTNAAFNGAVNAIALSGDGSGDIYALGRFTTYNGVANIGIQRVNEDGSADTGFAPTEFHSYSSMASVGDSIYLGYSGSIRRFNNDGSLDSSFDGKNKLQGPVYVIATSTDGSGDIYAGGRNDFRRLNNDGALDSSFATGSGFNGSVRAILPTSDSSGLFVVGDFTEYNGTSCNGIIKLNSDGSVDSSFDTGGYFSGVTINAIALSANGGMIYVASGNSYSTSIVRLNSDGMVDDRFTASTIYRKVYTIAEATDGSGDLYVGGTIYGGGILRLNIDGSIDDSFSVGSGFGGSFFTVYTIVPAADGSGNVYVGGRFTSYRDTTTLRIALLGPDGSIK